MKSVSVEQNVTIGSVGFGSCRFQGECASYHQHKEKMMKNTRKAMSLIVLGSAAVFAGLAPAAAAESDVRISYSSSSHGSSHRSSHSYSNSSTAGVLVINGRRYTISSRSSISRQIIQAFHRSGYDASVERGRILVCYDPCDSPRVSWQSRGYSGSIFQEDGRLTFSWNRVQNTYRSTWNSHTNSHSNSHRNSWNDRFYKKPRHEPRRRGSRRWCD